jgi:hypothetical protein
LSVLRSPVTAVCVVAFLSICDVYVTFAQTCEIPRGFAECGPSASVRAQIEHINFSGLVEDLDPTVFRTALSAGRTNSRSPEPDLSGFDDPPQSRTQGGVRVSRVFCRRDDYAYLPGGATAGIPCDNFVPGNMADPRQIARSMFDQMSLPSLRLNMNPRRGMVAVPTWFWVEGYDGNVITLADTLVLQHDECRRVADRDAGGAVVLDPAGAPVTHLECRTISDSMTVEVRAWPRAYDWSFGDDRHQNVRCPDAAACPEGIGLAFVDARTPSPIAHAYRWSSLGVNGPADAYTIGLGIRFGAQYRFSVNGASLSGWQSLDERELAWTASHQVQEAQAVLTRP